MTEMTTPMRRMPSVEPISDGSPPGGVGVTCCTKGAVPAAGADASDGLKFVSARMPMRAMSKMAKIPKLETAFIVLFVIIVSWRGDRSISIEMSQRIGALVVSLGQFREYLYLFALLLYNPPSYLLAGNSKLI